jgi:formate dehydrogenase major subunit
LAHPETEVAVVRATIDGEAHEFGEGLTILDAARSLGLDVPTLCHDERLRPNAVCRVCLVSLEGQPRPVPSCSTPLVEGMAITTAGPELEAARRGALRLLAASYPAGAVRRAPEKPLHRLFKRYGLERGCRGSPDPSRLDAAHPYLHVDMSQCIECYRCVRICDEVQGQFVWHVWFRGERTKVVAGDGGRLRDSDCVACGACVDTCPSGALEDHTVLAARWPSCWTRTTCPYCGVGCEMEVGTSRGKVVTVRPARGSAVGKGHLCSKGRYAWGWVASSERATRPMLREGADWRPVSWRKALAHVAARFAELKKRHGPDSLAVLGSARATNEDNYVAQKFARVVLGTHNVDCCARVCHAPSAAALSEMLGAGASTSSFDDLERARCILVCGANATENHPVVGARIKQAALRGAALIVVDPRRIELARYARLHLRPRPGTNIALLNAMATTILTEGLVAESFVRDRVDGRPELEAFLGAWSPERAEGLCGVPASQIREAARLYAGAWPAMSVHGLGMTEHAQGTEAVMCLVNLALLTGNLGVPGGGVNPLRGQNNVQGSAHMGCEPHHLTGYAAIEKTRHRFEECWQAPLPASPGLDLMEMMDAARDGRLKALFAIGYDVLLTNPHAAATLAALRRLELVVVQDLFLTRTAREVATVFLPAASAFEKDGTFMNAERRVQRVRAILPPPGKAKPDWQIVCELARAMGHPHGFGFSSAQQIWDEVRTVWPAGAGMSWARLEGAGLQWPCPAEGHPGTQLLHVGTFANGGRAALRRVDYRESPEQPDESFPMVLISGRSLYQFNAGTMTGRTPNNALRPRDLLDISPVDAGRIGLRDGEQAVVRSRHGETQLPVHLDDRVRSGEVFATFQTEEAFLNRVTGDGRDGRTNTPEYKLTAVRVERLAGATSREP